MTARAESPTIRLATISLGALAGLCATGIIVLSATDNLASEALTALAGLGGASAGALGTLLTTLTPAPLPGGRRQADLMPAVADATTITTPYDDERGSVPVALILALVIGFLIVAGAFATCADLMDEPAEDDDVAWVQCQSPRPATELDTLGRVTGTSLLRPGLL